ncbi:similar to Saccharomyces cerevisiae YOL069W NUF2 Component of the evolutionarily conserved kinetochore-associated Ndc80 complex (Ndc80p-Nuf2p-Spc24p-Spc25p) [Maudiozyma saulgeensis]|uniref:Similar to Saccharomyces cerevisiae YOL069W NUF2 Component of the evolutionarily conserved kinetochore-associated Ndc80 complex (Ndc80p-Nuf2p-Spc24p-Spc25p) n=1 Tax=Maudiozyma saulgeensis TaxID=1789683 RepID=A0A1X7RBC1_9SACH|nr:similar to Saccharomyces cerevisiae YOL069W NUF2 Component of the evolutionarily conserved kinetochore-associated Ndc80 complex (Ndc80p-Nuf2p-Spc24p-Spc25p) [Kazachstania saulgeensis]
MNRDVFPLLDVPEIVMCLESCDFTLATEDEISKPTSAYIMSLYEQIIKGFTGSLSDTTLNDTTKRMVDEETRLLAPTLRIITLNRTCYRFFKDIGVNDFGMMDLKKPVFERVRRLLSAVVNYARFREERMFDCKRFIATMEMLLNRLRSKFDDYNLLKQQTNDIQDLIGDYLQRVGININDLEGVEFENKIDEEYNKLEEHNKDLESELKKLTSLQETFSIDYNNYRIEKQNLLKGLESVGYRLIELDSKRDKLQKGVDIDMDRLIAEINTLKKDIETKMSEQQELEKKQNNLQISAKVYEDFINELYDLLRILSTDLHDSQRNERTLMEIKQQLTTQQENLKNVLSSTVLDRIAIFDEQIKINQPELQNLEELFGSQNQEFELKRKEISEHYYQVIQPKQEESEDYINRVLINGKIKTTEKLLKEQKISYETQRRQLEEEWSMLIDCIVKYMEDLLKDVKVV